MKLIDVDKLGLHKTDRNKYIAPEYADGFNYVVNLIEQAPVVNQWISVEDKLPNDNERILCFDPSLTESNLGAISVQFGWCCKRKNMNITHWMPLPQLPQKE